ncbi:MAG: hypothetical protein WC295_06145 [Methanoregula sp.]
MLLECPGSYLRNPSAGKSSIGRVGSSTGDTWYATRQALDDYIREHGRKTGGTYG